MASINSAVLCLIFLNHAVLSSPTPGATKVISKTPKDTLGLHISPRAAAITLNNGWDVLGSIPGAPLNKRWAQVDDVPAQAERKDILITYMPPAADSRAQASAVNGQAIIEKIDTWLEQPNKILYPVINAQVFRGGEGAYEDAAPGSSPECERLNRCFITSISGSPTELAVVAGPKFEQCISTPGDFLQCHFRLEDPGANSDGIEAVAGVCDSGKSAPTIENWTASDVDGFINVLIAGGVDKSYIYWPGRDSQRTFSEDVGKQLTDIDNYRCSLETQCKHDLQCATIGSRLSYNCGRTVYPSRDGYFLIAALENINGQLKNQNDALKGVVGLLALDTFNIGDFFPEPQQEFSLRNALLGLGTVLGAVAGFVPVIGPGIAAGGAILPAVGGFIGNSISARTDPMVGAETFAPKAKEIYQSILTALDTATEDLFLGKTIDGSFNITDMLKGGGWVNNRALTRVSELENKLHIEILSRSINALWKTAPSNKLWVIFNNLQDDAQKSRCLADVNGPQDSKLCNDGGVYYSYMYEEDGASDGFVTYPWGGKVLQEKTGIALNWVTEASANTYRLAKNQTNPLDPFNFNAIDGQKSFLTLAVENNGQGFDLINGAGKYPGSWTLPVCDTSTWGSDWNWDYTAQDYGNSPRKRTTHPPCLCGPGGSETDNWQKAAGMYNFDTFHSKCKLALESDDFVWPEGVTSVTYSSDEPFTINKPS